MTGPLRQWFHERRLDLYQRFRWQLTHRGICEGCGDPYSRKGWAREEFHYCSPDCARRAARRRARARKAEEEREENWRATQEFLETLRAEDLERRLAATEARLLAEHQERQREAAAREEATRCPWPWKRIYLDEADAQPRLEASFSRDPDARAYPCRCGFFHIGHPTERDLERDYLAASEATGSPRRESAATEREVVGPDEGSPFAEVSAAFNDEV
jgi:hypothetical protein